MAARAQGLQKAADEFDNFGRQAFGGLVDDEQVRVAHQGAAQGEHLLLAAREHPGLDLGTLAQTGKEGVHVLKRPARIFLSGLLTEQQVLLHRQAREDVAVFRHVTDAALRNLKRLAALDGPALPQHLALAIDQAHDGPGRGGAA